MKLNTKFFIPKFFSSQIWVFLPKKSFSPNLSFFPNLSFSPSILNFVFSTFEFNLWSNFKFIFNMKYKQLR